MQNVPDFDFNMMQVGMSDSVKKYCEYYFFL